MITPEPILELYNHTWTALFIPYSFIHCPVLSCLSVQYVWITTLEPILELYTWTTTTTTTWTIIWTLFLYIYIYIFFLFYFIYFVFYFYCSFAPGGAHPKFHCAVLSAVTIKILSYLIYIKCHLTLILTWCSQYNGQCPEFVFPGTASRNVAS